MVRWKFAGLRLALDTIIFYLLYKSYFIGVEIGIKMFQFDYWFITPVYGSAAAAVVYLFIGFVKKTIFFFAKSGTIWSLCNPDKTDSVMSVLATITVDWKETFSIPAINAAVRTLLSKIHEKIKSDEETPEIFKSLESSSAFKGLKNLAVKTFDYADECVLAWSYSHDDCLLQECLTGVAMFIKNAPKLIAYMAPVIILQTIIRGCVAAFFVVQYFHIFGFGLTTIVPCYIGVLGVDFVLYDALLEPFMMDGVIRKYLSFKNTDGIDELVEKIKAAVDTSPVESLVRRFSDNGENTGDNSGTEQSPDNERVE